MCNTKSSRIAAIKAEKGNEKPQCNEVEEINGIYKNIIGTHNVFSVNTVSNASGQNKYVESLFNNIPVRMIADRGSSATFI